MVNMPNKISPNILESGSPNIYRDANQLYYRETSSLRSSRPPATKLRHTGPLSSPRLLRDKTLRSSSPTSALPQLLLPPSVPQSLLLPPLEVLLPLRRRRSLRKKRLTSIWAAFSVMTIEHHKLYR